MKKWMVYGLAVACVSVLGWWMYSHQRSGAGPVEIGSKGGAASQGAPAAGAAPSAGQRPAQAGAPAASGGGPVAGAGGQASGGGGQPAAGAGRGPRGPVQVEAEKAQTMALAEELFAVGTLRANESVMVRPEMSGRVVRLGFTDGAQVKAGQLLVELDGSVLSAQAEQTRAELALSRANHERTTDLAQRNFVSQSARDQTAANLSVQEARLRLAEAQLAKTRIVAPFSGRLGLRNFSIGDFVKEGSDLVLIEDLATLKVDLKLPERFLSQLRRGLDIEVTVDAFEGRSFRAVLDALDIQVDANGRSVVARGVIANPDASLRSGMFAKARIVLRDKPLAVMVPEEAITPVGGDLFVYRIVEGKARMTRVTSGQRRDGKVEITDGIAAGELVVTAGQLKIQRDGQDVRVVNAGNRPAAADAPASGRPASDVPRRPPAG
jgi:membrane fusion protein (multidrug efflux system)